MNHAQKLRELAYKLIMADAHGHATKACQAGAEALDLVATQGAEIARLRTALEQMIVVYTDPTAAAYDGATTLAAARAVLAAR